MKKILQKAKYLLAPQKLNKVIIYLEIANQHRNTLLNGLANTLVKSGCEVIIFCESKKINKNRKI